MITMAEVNVRVAVRVRPLLPKEKLAGEEICLRIIPSAKQIVLGKDRGFTFDHVLPSTTSQDDVYKTCVEQLVKNIFDGYNATVFAYGQTGSGKTYTVGGNVTSQLEEEYGIIPRALKEIFSIIQNKKDVDFTIKVSYIEIYKEELQDLLDTETNKEMHVREDDKGNTVIIGAREAECETLDEVMMLLDAGSAARQTGATQMNEHSSRSHSIFTVVINQKWDDSDVLSEKRKKSSISEGCEIIDEGITHCMSGKFHFVDLAGSERVHRTGNVGDRFKESVHINSGLLALGNVISALGDPKKKNPHIPYRESKITRLLKDSLGGNSNTVMICCISPAISSFDETLNSLKYANRARNIKNKPIVNRDVQSIRFAELQSEIQFLREELVRQKTNIIANGIDNCDGDQAQDSSLMKELEEKVIKLQTECSHYQIVADEAYKHVKEILERNILSKSVDFRLRDWLDLMEEIKNRVPNTLSRESFENQTILDLTDQLEKCKKDLEEDESIFAQKDSEIRDRDQRIEELEIMLAERDKQLTDADEKTKQQEQQLIAQQMKIEELQKALKEALFNESSLDDDAVSASAPPAPVTGRRPKSVPAHIHKRPDTTGLGLRPMSRNIKTSPALFTLERVMKSFRARSQLLVSRLEDTDDVLHPTFNDDDDNQPQPPTDPQESSDGFTRFTRRGTFKIKKGRKDTDKENNANGGNVPEIEITKDETDISSSKTGSQIRGLQREETFIQKSMETKQQLNDAKHKMKESAQKLRDLSINIKLKEQLIRELVRSGKDADTMNKQYASKIDTLEKEKERVKSELTETQKQLQELEAKGQQESSEKIKLQQEFQKKIENAKARISTLQRKQKDTEKIANITGQNEKKIEDLNLAIDRMKQQQENLQKKLKEETERKAKLEREALKEAQRVKELELKNEQQQKLLKRKNEEIAAAQRKLRSGSLPPINMDDLEKIDEQKKWLDNEVERVVEQKRQVQDLKEDLKKREIILAKKEAILAEKSQLEMKKLRSSQVLDKSLLSLSSKLETIDRKLKEKNKELGASVEGNQSSIREEINKLSAARDQMQKKRETLEVKLHEGHLLSEQEERRLIEIDEAVDALDAAIEYKNDIINSRQHSIQHSNLLLQSEENVINRLNTLSAVETRSLLMKYFDKVISLREEERRKSFRCSEMEVKIDEQERLIHELEVTLERAKSDIDRRATKIQREYEEKIHLLMKQLNEASHSMGGGDSNSARVQQLEKELYYYKKTSRELKKRLRDYNVAVSASHGGDDNPLSSSLQSSVAESEVIEDLPSRILPHRERESHPGSIRHSSRPNSASQMSSNAAPKITPVKISRRDLRPVSENEVKLRRSNLTAGQSAGSQQLQDSLDLSAASQNNPWT